MSGPARHWLRVSCLVRHYNSSTPTTSSSISTQVHSWLKRVKDGYANISPLFQGEAAVRARTQVNSLMTTYEDFIGIRQVKEAQGRVLQAEQRFGEAQEGRRTAQHDLNTLEMRLREVRFDLEKTPRGEQQYLELVKREMELIREERVLRDRFERQEKEERDLFGSLSSALRASHEKERAQTEKTKYWSLIGSIIGAAVGIVGTTISSRLKMNELKSIVTASAESREEVESKLLSTVAQVNTLLGDLEERLAALSLIPTAVESMTIVSVNESSTQSSSLSEDEIPIQSESKYSVLLRREILSLTTVLFILTYFLFTMD